MFKKRVNRFRSKKLKLVKDNIKESKSNKLTIKTGKKLNIAYSKKGKELFLKKKIFKKVLSIFLNYKKKVYEDKNMKLQIERRSMLKTFEKETVASMILKLKKSNKKFYIKVGPKVILSNRTVREIHSLKLLRNISNINIVTPHLALSIGGYNFILYDYMPYPTVFKACRKERKNLIKYKLEREEQKINAYLKEHYKELGFKKAVSIGDLSTKNTFIDLKTNKLYVFDTMMG